MFQRTKLIIIRTVALLITTVLILGLTFSTLKTTSKALSLEDSSGGGLNLDSDIQNFAIIRMKRSEISDATLEEIASQFQIVIDNSYAFTLSSVKRLHQINPQIKVLRYLNATVIGDNEPYYAEISTYPDWFLLNAAEERVTIHGNPHRFPLDPGNSEWQDYIAQKAYDRINSSDYDGIFLDVVLPYVTVGSGNFNSLPLNPKTGTEYTNEQWAQAQHQKLEKMKTKIGNKLLVSNGVGWGKYYYKHNGQIFFDAVDGIMVEGFVRWGTTPLNNFRSEKDWKADIDMLEEIDSKVNISLVYTKFLNSLSGTPEQKENYKMYSLATFLLGKGNSHFFAVGEIEADEFGTTQPKFSTVYDPGWSTKIGSPLASYYKQDNVYQRDFTNGKVLANPTEDTYEVDLQRVYKTLEGKRISSVKMKSNAGMILLNTQQNQVEILVTFKEGVSKERIDSVNATHGTKVISISSSSEQPLHRLEVLDEKSAEEKAAEYKALPEVKSAEPNHSRYISSEGISVLNMGDTLPAKLLDTSGMKSNVPPPKISKARISKSQKILVRRTSLETSVGTIPPLIQASLSTKVGLESSSFPTKALPQASLDPSDLERKNCLPPAYQFYSPSLNANQTLDQPLPSIRSFFTRLYQILGKKYQHLQILQILVADFLTRIL